MKKSNRLLIALFLLALLVIVFANFTLYREYRNGHITTRDQLMADNLTTTQLPPTHHVSLTGIVWANIIPSDSNYIEYTKGDQETTGNYVRQLRQSGDTLYLTGPFNMPNHRAWAEWLYRHSFAPINIHLKSTWSIDATNSHIYLQGAAEPNAHESNASKPNTGATEPNTSKPDTGATEPNTSKPNANASEPSAGPPPTTIRINAIGSSVWIGEYNELIRNGAPKEYFDSLDLRLDNTILLLNRPAVIAKLHARLDNNSELNDRITTLGAADISPGPDSRVSITGTNIPNTTINIH